MAGEEEQLHLSSDSRGAPDISTSSSPDHASVVGLGSPTHPEVVKHCQPSATGGAPDIYTSSLPDHLSVVGSDSPTHVGEIEPYQSSDAGSAPDISTSSPLDHVSVVEPGSPTHPQVSEPCQELQGDQPDHVALDISDTPGNGISLWRCMAIAFIIQMIYVGSSIINKKALNEGMQPAIFATYRNLLASIVLAPFAIMYERNVRPYMTLWILLKIFLLAIFEPVLDQILFYSGFFITSAAFSSSLSGVLLGLTFFVSWIFRLEKVDMRLRSSQAKVFGTLLAVGGVVVASLYKGPIIVHSGHGHFVLSFRYNLSEAIVLMGGGLLSAVAYTLLLTKTVQQYPAFLSLLACVCFIGSVIDFMIAIILEQGFTWKWMIRWNWILLAYTYGVVMCSAVAVSLQTILIRARGSVFVTSISPVSMAVLLIIAPFFMEEPAYLGSVFGVVLIATGLFLILWGKRREETA